MDEYDYEYLQVDPDGDVFTIRIDRPEIYNALSQAVFVEIETAVEQGAVSDARVLVLEGMGENFSAGGDYKWEQDKLENERVDFHRRKTLGRPRFMSILNCPKPLVTKVRGYAVGTGATLATLGDIVIASEDATLGDLHIQNGTNAPDTPAFWPLLIGVNKTKELIMLGELISGTEAERIGLVNRAVPEEELDETVDEIVRKLATGPQTSIMFNKILVNKWYEFASVFLRREAYGLEGIAAQLPDHEEAVTAFNDKREPVFPSARPVDQPSESD